MDGVGAGLGGDAQHFVDIQIGGDRFAGFTNAITAVGFESMQRKAILFRVNGDVLDAELRGRAHYPDRNLAAVRNQQTMDLLGCRQSPVPVLLRMHRV